MSIGVPNCMFIILIHLEIVQHLVHVHVHFTFLSTRQIIILSNCMQTYVNTCITCCSFHCLSSLMLFSILSVNIIIKIFKIALCAINTFSIMHVEYLFKIVTLQSLPLFINENIIEVSIHVVHIMIMLVCTLISFQRLFEVLIFLIQCRSVELDLHPS